MSNHLLKQRRVWYATLNIPKDVRGKFGKRRFKQSLKTESLTVAQERVGELVSHWKALIRAKRDGTDFTSEGLAAQLKEWPEEDRHWGETVIADIAESLGRPELWYEATGRWTKIVKHLDEYLDQSNNTQKTKDMKRSDIRKFAKVFSHFEKVNAKDVKAWVRNDLLTAQGLAPKTAKRIVGFISAYWKWCADWKDLEVPYPFTGVIPRMDKSSKDQDAERTHYSVSDYKKLLKASDQEHDQQLQDLISLGAYTGCRIEELCSLKLESDVLDDRFVIRDAKTKAGVREVPIHKDIRQLVERLKQTSEDGYLLSGLTTNKYGDRSNAIGKRFGRLKGSLGFGRGHVFHSFRNSIARQLEDAGVPESIAARITGHKISTMTYGVYSKGVSFGVMSEAMAKISYM